MVGMVRKRPWRWQHGDGGDRDHDDGSDSEAEAAVGCDLDQLQDVETCSEVDSVNDNQWPFHVNVNHCQ